MIGWMTDVTEADTYFNTRVSDAEWRNLDETKKEAALTHAYNRINNSPRFSIPAAPAAAQLVKLAYAQCEMAYYLAYHLDDEDRRKGLQAQGVISAGIAKETYDKDMLSKLPFPPAVEELLEDFSTEEAMSMIPIDRDEDKDLETDVVEED